MRTVIIDLDHTLLNTTKLKTALAQCLGLSLKQWNQAYKNFLKDYKIFDPKVFLQGVSSEQQTAFYNEIKKISSYLYPDSKEFIKILLKKGWRVVILTYGNKPWQQLKVDHLNFPKAVIIEITNQAKIATVKKYISDQTVFIDDIADNIDTIKQAYPEVETYWMKRPNGNYTEQPSKLADKIIENLNINL